MAQNKAISTEAKSENWTVFNREADFKEGVIYLDAKENDGLLWLNNSSFSNGVIELDIKGKNSPGQSFVGLAFHGVDNYTFEAVYFRPFNFQNQERNSYSMQYISMPDNDWRALRTAHPGKYENKIEPAPAPEEWLHAKIVINYPYVTVYVNGSKEPSLEVKQISAGKTGMIGFWVGNGSEGWFKDLKFTLYQNN